MLIGCLDSLMWREKCCTAEAMANASYSHGSHVKWCTLRFRLKHSASKRLFFSFYKCRAWLISHHSFVRHPVVKSPVVPLSRHHLIASINQASLTEFYELTGSNKTGFKWSHNEFTSIPEMLEKFSYFLDRKLWKC